MDVDEVVADLLSEWIGLYNTMFRDNVDPLEISEWDLNKVVKPEARDYIYKMLEVPSLYRHVKPIRGALFGIDRLRQIGYSAVFVTTCVEGSADQKIGWLRRHGFCENRSAPRDVVIAADKALIMGDLLVDDAIHNVTAFHSQTVLVDRAYNRNFFHPHRARDWYEIVDLVQRLVPIK